MSDGRCTHRKHFVDGGKGPCDCGALTILPTAAGNANIVTLLYTVTTGTVSDMLREVQPEE